MNVIMHVYLDQEVFQVKMERLDLQDHPVEELDRQDRRDQLDQWDQQDLTLVFQEQQDQPELMD